MLTRLRQAVNRFLDGTARDAGQPRRRLEVEGLEQRELLSVTPVATIPTPRSHLSAVTGSDGLIYTVGGIDSAGHVSGAVEVYNPASNSWYIGTSLPTPRFDLALVQGGDGRIYAIGGAGGVGQTLSVVEAYNPTTDSWTPVASLPTPRDLLGAAVGPQGEIYAIGGHQYNGGADTGLNTVEVYSPTTGSWTVAANLPQERVGLSVVTGSDGRVFALGGGERGVSVYTPSTDSWQPLGNMPTARSHMGATRTAEGNIITLGGTVDPNGQPTTIVEMFSPSTNSWAIVDYLSAPRAYFAAVTGHDGQVYLLGGSDGQNVVGTVDVTTPPTSVVRDDVSLFVNRLYQDFLGRPADPLGLSFWSALVGGGVFTRENLAALLQTTDEYRQNLVNGMFQRLLNRPADGEGLRFFSQLLQATSEVEVEALIIASPEYYATRGNGNNADFLASVYQDVLGRPIDDAGRGIFTSALQQGVIPHHVVMAILLSEEGRRVTLNGFYQTLLGRNADAGGLQAFTDDLSFEGGWNDVIGKIAGSTEYYSKL